MEYIFNKEKEQD